jgi:hypothetical protein
LQVNQPPFENKSTCRVLQIKELVKECIRQKDVEVTIESNTNDEPAPLLLKRSACVDASAFSPLRKIVSKRQQLLPDKKGVVITTETDEFGTKEQVQVRNILQVLNKIFDHSVGVLGL